MDLNEILSQRLLWAFNGKYAVPPEMTAALRAGKAAGVTLFRPFNVDHPAQLRALTDALQAETRAAGLPPLLVCADQEGGQLMAVGFGTPLPGNMALGAVGSPDLARRAGQVLGSELAAVGVNLNYAPVCDVNTNPRSPAVGVRSFGEDPRQVGELAAALVEGLQSRGVAATLKHFPGAGDAAGDSHFGLPSLQHSRERLEAVELPPFAAGVRAGARAVMTAHLAVPALDVIRDRPTTLSPDVLGGLLRGRMGFEGVIITDALDMKAVEQGPAQWIEVVCAARAGADLLLMTSFNDQEGIYTAVRQAARRGLLEWDALEESARRVLALKTWLSNQTQPGLEVVACREHLALADEIARCALTLVRDLDSRLPLHPGQKTAVILPRPADLTPADTSSYVAPDLAGLLRARGLAVEAFETEMDPSPGDIGALLAQLTGFDNVLIGTINAVYQTGQAELVRAAQAAGLNPIVMALRLPTDLAAFPETRTYMCTYSILEPSMRALAAALLGEIGWPGRLPVSVPGLYPVGYSLNEEKKI